MSTITSKYLSSKVNGIKINNNYPCNEDNCSNNSSRNVKYIVIHYTGNSKDTALNNCKYFQSPNRSASAHFFCDDENIYQSVELRDSAWHCGCSLGYKTACRNSNSIGIEMCCTAGNYKISTKTQKNAAFLCARLCELIGIKASQVDTYVLRHYDVVKTNKKCPAQYVDNASEWKQFKTWVKNILKYGDIKKTSTSTTTTTSTKYTKKQFIKDVQSSIGAKVDGIVGNDTLSKLVTVSKNKSSKHSVVKYLQKYLKSLGYSLSVSGVFNKDTYNIVVEYQKKNGLNADGIVGNNTWKKLLL